MTHAFVYWIRHVSHQDIKTQGYVGFTTKLPKKRFSDHLWNARNDLKKSARLGAAIRKYGEQEIVLQIVCKGTMEYCLEMENRLRPDFNIGWNLGVGGESPTIGRLASLEQRQHFSKVHTGRRHTEEWKRAMSERHKGKKFRLGGKMPESAKEKIKNAKGRCKYCEREMTIPMIVRWHDEKCPEKIKSIG